jgi:hypothetical protein
MMNSDPCVGGSPPIARRLPLRECTPQKSKLRRQSLAESATSHNKKVKHGSCLKRLVSLSEVEPDSPTAVAISDCVKRLFGDNVEALPCITARMFATFQIWKARAADSETSSEILEIWKAIVAVECIAINSVLVSVDDDSPPKQSRIQFCGFECSSLSPPIDRLDGSDEHQQDMIDALLHVKQRFDATQSTETLHDAIAFFERTDWLHQAALSIHENYPVNRVQKCCNFYRTELQGLLQRRGQPQQKQPTVPKQPLELEQRLAHIVGQGIRYQLRSLLNPAPVRYGSADTTYEQRSHVFSKVQQHVELWNHDNNDCTLTSIFSALVSLALLRLYEYFGTDQVLWTTTPCDVVDSSWTIGDYDNDSSTESILHQLDSLTSVLSAACACRFLVQLLTTIPAVDLEIERRGGWSLIETFTTYSYDHDLYKLCPDDAHFVVLSNVPVLMQKLQQLLPILEARRSDYQERLAALIKYYKLNTKNAIVLRKFPRIHVLAAQLEEGRARYQMFPVRVTVKTNGEVSSNTEKS